MKNILQSLAIGALLSLSSTVADAQYIIHIAGNSMDGHTGDGSPAYYASLRSPGSIAKDKFGNFYIGDGGPFGYQNDACIRKIEPIEGIITTIAGLVHALDSPSNTADNIPAVTAKLNGCAAICFDTAGNLLIADGTSCIRKINMKTLKITTIVGSKTATGYSGDGNSATAALLNQPYDIAIDAVNNLYIADLGNNVIRRVSNDTTNPIITTVAGRHATYGFSGDNGPALNAKLDEPRGIALDASGNLFIADYNNNRVRKVTKTTGIITTVVGGGPGFGGDGGPAIDANLSMPARLTFDRYGNMYIADAANQRIRKVTLTTNIISTFAGNGKYFGGPDTVGDGRLATKACIVPYGMCFDNCDNMYVGSSLYNIRAITAAPPPNIGATLCGLRTNAVENAPAAIAQELQVYPNPNSGTFTVNLPSTYDEPMQIVITDVTGRKIKELAARTNKDIDLQIGNTPGLYFVQVAAGSGKWSRKVVVQ